jgi:hypothetical protein
MIADRLRGRPGSSSLGAAVRGGEVGVKRKARSWSAGSDAGNIQMKITEESRSWAALGGLLILAMGCAGSAAVGGGAATGGITKRDTTITHEPCDIANASEKIDANNDGRPDIFIVRKGSTEVCRAVDLNFDGVIDVFSYNDSAGRLRRREYAYGRNGLIDEIATYQGGVLTEKDQATSMARKLDTWDFYQNGTLTRTERDSNGDGIIDQWWEYTQPGCPLIHSDVNNDGKPDPGATVDYCKETGYVPPERQGPAAPQSPDVGKATSTPTEVDSKPADEAKPATKEPKK